MSVWVDVSEAGEVCSNGSEPEASAADQLLWCLQHRAVPVGDATITTTDPGDFGVPAMPIRATLSWWQRGAATDWARAFTAETLKHAAADPRCTALSRTDVVHPRSEFRRFGPYLWARLRGDAWVLIEIDLWPQLRADAPGCCPRPLDAFQTLGVVTLVEDRALLVRAEQALGPNGYAGICPCSAW
jgi:hypothetical protein